MNSGPAGSDECPREMGGGAGLLQEALLLAAQETKPTEKGPRMPKGFPAPEPSAEGSPPLLPCFGSEGVNTRGLSRATKQVGTGVTAYKGGQSSIPHLAPCSLSSAFSLGTSEP